MSLRELSDKQKALLTRVYQNYVNEKGYDLNYSIDDFVYEFVGKNSKTIVHKDLSFILSNIYTRYNNFIPKRLSFDNLEYIVQEETADYIIGIQKHLKKKIEFKIMSFKNIMVLDYDNTTLESIETILKRYPYTFDIYATHNGYHVYVVSRTFDIADKQTLQLMHDMKSDPYYISFCKFVGCCVRLQKKANRQEEFIEKFIKRVGDVPVDRKIDAIIAFKDKLINHVDANF